MTLLSPPCVPAEPQGPPAPRTPHSLQLAHSRVSDVSFHETTYWRRSDTGRVSEEDTSRGTPDFDPFILSPSLPRQVPLFGSRLSLRARRLPSPLLTKRWAIPGSCCVSQCPFTWLASPISMLLLSQGLALHGPLSRALAHSSICISISSLRAGLPGPAAFLSSSPSGFWDFWG